MIASPSVVAHMRQADVRDLALARLAAQLADDLERLAPAVECPSERWPPLVLTGSAPPSSIRPPAIKSAASPGAQ